MRAVRSYVFEVCWLVLLVFLALTPAKVLIAQQGFNFSDFAADCDAVSGWCIPLLEA